MTEKQKERINKLGLSETAFAPSDKTAEERLLLLVQQMTSLTSTMQQISDSMMEVIKKDASEMPVGDYVNPIAYVSGMTVEQGKFYTNGDDIWEAIQSGVPAGFDDRTFFDIIG